MLAACLHPCTGNDPDFLVELDLVPSRTDYLAGSSGRQDEGTPGHEP
jgi:hypothetical protein